MMNENRRNSVKAENPFYNLIFNIVLPTLIMIKFSSPERLGPTNALLLGIAMPLAYGIWDYYQRKTINTLSIVGLVSVFLTGFLGLMKLSGFWFAVKEASIPTIIGIAFLISILLKKPLIKLLLFNDNLFNMNTINSHFEHPDDKLKLENLLHWSTFFVSLSFFLSAVLNFYLAFSIVTSTPGSTEYVSQIGKFTGMSYIVIALPSMFVMIASLFWLIHKLKCYTNLKMEELLKSK